MAQLVQSVEESVDQLCRPVEGGEKVFLSPSDLLFPVELILFPVEVRSRSNRGPVEVRLRLTVTCQAFNANG